MSDPKSDGTTDPDDVPTNPTRPSTAASMLDAIDGPGLERVANDLRARLRETKLPLNSSRAAHIRALANSCLVYYSTIFHEWPRGVITESSQWRSRREFTELCRHVWAVLEP